MRISGVGRFGFLPLLHTLVEERVGERRLATFHVGSPRSTLLATFYVVPFSIQVPLSLSLSPPRGARGRDPMPSKENAKN